MTTLLNNEAAAAALGISPVTLKIWRCKGKGPRFIKLGSSPRDRVVYDPAEIEAWKAARTFASTSAATVSHPGDA
ncbi:Helix-turn-helix domain-containing protein [Sphingomonas laterariae]|uniref:Helix-turn-helix domain-containing protein n=1 Tax=Edaphosphingomonas laterariae TaxID=861865 RepID=A0A239EW51_9SPHN|nr:helix-turn-helix domain-containing protein [Sphingomonas laterariae]SNS48122.1 Helix-turn-helix domain-containing protein [Sphingomonas laterariae]